MSGIQIFEREQQRQIEHGWTPEHDDLHVHGEIAEGANCYVMMNILLQKKHTIEEATAIVASLWPFEPEGFKPSGNYMTNIRKAGGMLAAEYDRLERAEAHIHCAGGAAGAGAPPAPPSAGGAPSAPG